MTAWSDRILQEFPADLSRFWIALDPDDLLLDDRILHRLRERGFEVLLFEDSIAFRTEYEENWRSAWDQGRQGPAKALILQLHGTNEKILPRDYLQRGRKVSLNLAKLFSGLSYNVVRELNPEDRETLFSACRKHRRQTLGENATRDFVLSSIFHTEPHNLTWPEGFWRHLLQLHSRGMRLPDSLANYLAARLQGTPARGLPVAKLLTSRSAMLRLLQEAWEQYLTRHQKQSDSVAGNADPMLEAQLHELIPFDHPELSFAFGRLFAEGSLEPVRMAKPPDALPDSLKPGILQNSGQVRPLVLEGIKSLAEDIPSADAPFSAWMKFAQRLGETVFRFHSLGISELQSIQQQVQRLQHDADEHFGIWLGRHFADLASLPIARGPVILNQVPRYLALHRDKARTALLVFDGLAIDQWIQIREYLAKHLSGFHADEKVCFAWLPSLTSVSRQAVFSGQKPREFRDSIAHTSREHLLWRRFWQEQGLQASQVFYQKSLQQNQQLTQLEEKVARPEVQVAGLVIDMVDKMVHGARLGKRGLVGQIRNWCETGFVEQLLQLLARCGYQIYLTSDHGNLDAEGIGRPGEGQVPEAKGERVRIYRNELLARSLLEEMETTRLPPSGLPDDYLPVYAKVRGAFVPRGEQLVAHGGPSVEELLVPFVEISIAGDST